MDSNRLILFPHAPEYIRAVAQGPDSYKELSGFMRAASEEFLKQLQTTNEPQLWSFGFAVVELKTNTVVGVASFKGPPSAERSVEISYGITPAFQRRGYATEAAMALVRFARVSGRVSMVIAHTVPTNEASKRVLEKCGFRKTGEVIDAVDGLVLRWELAVD